MLDALAAPQPLHHLDCLGRATAAFMNRHAARFVLAREFAADAHAENEMAGAEQAVERRDHLGGGHRMPQRQQVHTGAEGEFRFQRRQVCERCQRIVDWPRERDVVGRPQNFVAPSRDRLEPARRFLAA
jgi:hypothetical protein